MNPELRAAIDDPANIPMALTPDAAICIASLLQLALRNQDVRRDTPSLYILGIQFTEGLIEKIISRAPTENKSSIQDAFDRGWNPEWDVTVDEFNQEIDPFYNSYLLVFKLSGFY